MPNTATIGSSHKRVAWIRAGFVGIGCLLVAVTLTLRQREANTSQVRERFDASARALADSVVARVKSYESGLRGARGAIAALGEERMSREAFRAYYMGRDLSHEFPGALGFGFIRHVHVGEEAAFVSTVRAHDMPTFAIRQLEPHDGDQYVIQYIEPFERNGQAVGLDIASNRERRDAAQYALQTRQATLTAPITLVQATGKPSQGFLLLLPIADSTASAARPDGSFGWSYAPLLVDEILGGLVSEETGIALSIADADRNSGAAFFSRSQATAQTRPMCTKISRSLFGRVWKFGMCAQPRFVQNLHLLPIWPLFAIGGFGSLLIAVLVGVYGHDRIRQLQLQAQGARLISIVENSSDAVIALDRAGRVLDWNNAAQSIFGYATSAALGQQLDTLIGIGGADDQETFDYARALHGEMTPHVDVTRRCADGTWIDVSIASSPIVDAKGNVRGAGLTIRDIRDRKRAQRQLTEWNATLEREVTDRTEQLDAARRHLQTVLDALPSVIGYWDKDLRNRFANHAYRPWYGLDPADLPGKHMRELFGDALFERNRPYVEAVLRGEPQTFERSIPRPDGKGARHALAHFLPDLVNGEVRGFYALVHDVTELSDSRLKLAEALRNNEALLSTLDKLAIVSMTDRHGKITYVNHAFCAISGYSLEELIGQDHRIVNSGEHPREFWRDMWRTISQGTPWRGEICNRAKNGALYWVDSMIAPHIDKDGQIERYISIRLDITETKLAAKELLRERERLAAILRGTGVGTWEWNVQTGEMRLNERFANMIGYTLRDLDPITIDTWMTHTDPEDWAQCKAALDAHFQGERDSYESESRMLHRAGHSVWVLRRGRVTTRTQDGAPEWMHGTQQDVSADHAAASELRRAMQAAEAANAAKSSFLANMSHEIRTPLNAVVGLAYLLEQTRLDVEQRARLNQLQVASRSLLGVINDVLDLSKIEAGEMALEDVPFELRILFDELNLLMQPQAAEKGLSLNVRCDAAVPRVLQGDPTRLRQVLLNLISNAIKFTERGSVSVQANALDTRSDSVLLECRVRDTGIGIPATVQERIFLPFTQADTSTTRRYGGTGLGLPIVRHLTELMGGKVTLQSTPGVGTEFIVSVRLHRAAASASLFNALGSPHSGPPQRVRNASSPPNEARLCGVRVMVVDDSIINLDVARSILELEGATVFSAANGCEAVDFLRTAQAIDIVLMDIQMPIMDGLEATRMLRGELGLAQLPVIALTAGALVSERQRALDAGMTGFATKPLDPEALIRTMREHVERLRGIPLVPRLRPLSASQAVNSDPQIEGLDLSVLQAPLRQDHAEIRRLLRMMFREFTDIAQATIPDLADSGLRERWAAHVHKLRGSAGVLGAKEVHRLAEQAELALRSNAAVEQVLPQCRALAAALAQLHERARSFLETQPAQPEPDPQAVTLDLAAVRQLLMLLRENDLSARAHFQRLALGLAARLDAERFAVLQDAVDSFRFDQAASLLETLAA